MQCGHILDFSEGSKVNGKMRWFSPDSIVCFACDPETNGTNYTISGKKDLSSIEEDSVVKELSAELDDADNHQENYFDNNSNGNVN